MAIQLLTPFRADVWTAEGGRDLAGGIAGGLTSVGDALGQAIDRRKKEGQISTQLSKLLETAYPERADEFKTWSLPQKKGFLQAEAMRSGQREQDLAEQKLLADLQDRAAAAGVMRHVQSSLAPLLQMQPGEGPLAPDEFEARVAQRTGLSPAARALIEGYATTGATPPASVLGDLVNGGRPNAPLDWEAIRPREFTTPSGARGVYGKSGQFQFDPTIEKAAQPVAPKVGVGQHPLTGEPQVTWTGSPEDFATQFPGAKLPAVGEKKTTSATSAPLPLPKDRKELKKGQRYTTSRGVATWNGTAFEQ